MTYEQFIQRIDDACESHEAHGKVVRDTARNDDTRRRAFAEYGDQTARAAFMLLTGRFV